MDELRKLVEEKFYLKRVNIEFFIKVQDKNSLEDK